MMSKRVWGILLVLSMLLSVCVFVPAEAAIGIEHEEQVSKLNAFGILSGYPDTSYNPTAQVSAREFVTAAYKLNGRGVELTQAVAERFGFGADDKSITVLQAVTVLLDALDYNYEAESYGDTPIGVQKTAARHGLLVGTDAAFDSPLTNDAMAVLLYNTLDLKIPEVVYTNGGVKKVTYSNTTVLEHMQIYKGEGVLTGNAYAALQNCAQASDGMVYINRDKAYALGATYADELLGYYVEFYYNEDNELLWIDAGSQSRVNRIAERDIVSLRDTGVDYFSGNTRKKSVSFDAPTVLQNGKAVQNPDWKSLIPLSGYVVTIDNDGDGRAEVVSCEAYEYYLVDGKNAQTRMVSDFETGQSLVLDPNRYDRLRILKNGVEIGFDEIQEDDLLAVLRSDTSGGVLRAEVSPHPPISGSITAVSSERLSIDGTSYQVSTAYQGAKLSLNLAGTFYRDLNGHIVRYARSASMVSQYAYLIAAGVGGFKDESCYMKLLTAGGTVEERRVADRVKHNNGYLSAKQLYDRFLNGGEIESQLITYTLSSDGRLACVEKANRDNLYSGSDEESEVFSLYFSGHGRYRKNNLCFNSKYLIEADTPIFVVPASRKSEDYEVLYAQSLVNGTSYYISVYDIDAYMTAGAIVLDEIASEPEQLKSKRSILVDSVATGLNAAGETIVMVEGYQQGSRVTLKTKESAFLKDADGRYYSLGAVDGYTELSRGDVMQTSLDANGNLLAFRTLYKADEARKKLVVASSDTPNEYEEGGNVNEFADLFVLHGKVLARSSSVLVVESDTKRAHKITNGASVYLVDSRGIEKVTVSDISAYDEVYLHTYQGNLQEVVIYSES